jgi:ubiquinone/menaquinone biosynthesis C-methylase UbiE
MMRLDKTLPTLIGKFKGVLGENDSRFINRVYRKDHTIYQNRLRQYGFVGKKRVLDAACGFGQWSLALSALNHQVAACDISRVRIDFLRELAATLHIDNLTLSQQSLENLTYSNQSFDAIFCYGALFLTPWKTVLAEFSRAIETGGLLYVNANGFGWYQHLWLNQPNKTSDYDPQLLAAKSLVNTWNYQHGLPTEPGLDVLISPEELESEMNALGFDHIEVAPEGCLKATDLLLAKSKAFFKGEFGNQLGVYEALARKIA